MDPTTTAHSSALHHSQISSTTGADGQPILTTGLVTPSIDFNPDQFRSTSTGAGAPMGTNPFLGAQVDEQQQRDMGSVGNYGYSDATNAHAHSNAHPVVAKSGVDLSQGTARPAETTGYTGSAPSADSVSRSAGNAAQNVRDGAQDTANRVSSSASQTANQAANSASRTADQVSSSASNAAQQVSNSASNAATQVSATASDAANRASASASNAAQTVKDNAPTVTGIRQRAGSISNTVGAKVGQVSSNVSAQVQHAAEHPAVQNVKKDAQRQVGNLRERLGRYPIVLEAEKRTGVDRVALVIGGAILYLLLIPLNLFGLALPTTQLLTFLPATLLALRALDQPSEDRTKILLSYFVVFGFVQFTESLMAGFLERKIPQYYTVKLLFLAYLIHPRTQGALKIHAQVLRPLLAQAQQATKPSTYTPPTSKPASDSAYPSPTSSAYRTDGAAQAAAQVPLSRTAGYAATGPSSGAGGPVVVGLDGYPIGSVAGGQGNIHLPSGGGTGVGADVPKY